MAAKKIKGKIEEIINETENVKSFWIKLEEELDFVPGHFVMLTMPGLEKKGAFSIGSSPTEGKDRILLTIQKVGLLTGRMHDAKVGDEVTVMGPLGEFLFEEQDNDLVFLAGGCGIVPFRCIIKYVLDKNLKNKMVLLYSSRTKEDIIYKKDWQKFREDNFRNVITLTRQEWEGPMGRISEDLIKENIKDLNDPMFYICGPEILVGELREKIENLGYKKIKIDKWR